MQCSKWEKEVEQLPGSMCLAFLNKSTSFSLGRQIIHPASSNQKLISTQKCQSAKDSVVIHTLKLNSTSDKHIHSVSELLLCHHGYPSIKLCKTDLGSNSIWEIKGAKQHSNYVHVQQVQQCCVCLCQMY